eukprot:scaffold219_cov119-Skeletonema_dohrnii-CCMP3373.AAC.4
MTIPTTKSPPAIQQRQQRQDSPTMDVSTTPLKKSPKPQPASPPPVTDGQTSEKKCYRLEEYPEDIGRLIKQLSFQEAVVKAKEEAIKKWTKTLADATKANEGGPNEGRDAAKWQKALDDATKLNETRRKEEFQKWQKVKADAISKRDAKHLRDLATWQKAQEIASTTKQVARAEKMLKELEVNQSTPSKEMKKAEKMLSQLAKEEDMDANPSSEMKHARKMLLRAQQGKIPSNDMRRAERTLKQLKGEMEVFQGQVVETKKLIRDAAASADLKSIFVEEGAAAAEVVVKEKVVRQRVKKGAKKGAKKEGAAEVVVKEKVVRQKVKKGAKKGVKKGVKKETKEQVKEEVKVEAKEEEKDQGPRPLFSTEGPRPLFSTDDAAEFVIEESPTNVFEGNCGSNFKSHCTPFYGAWSDLVKNATVCNPTACFE